MNSYSSPSSIGNDTDGRRLTVRHCPGAGLGQNGRAIPITSTTMKLKTKPANMGVVAAVQTADFLQYQIRSAHREACTNKATASLLEMALFDLIEPANRLKDRLERINAAINCKP